MSSSGCIMPTCTIRCAASARSGARLSCCLEYLEIRTAREWPPEADPSSEERANTYKCVKPKREPGTR
jgi:hypothetical protein